MRLGRCTPSEAANPLRCRSGRRVMFQINHTTDNHSFFVSHGNNPVVDIYRFDFLNGTRQFVRQLRPADATGTEGISDVLMTPDGKGYEYGGVRRLSNLFVVTGEVVFSLA